MGWRADGPPKKIPGQPLAKGSLFAKSLMLETEHDPFFVFSKALLDFSCSWKDPARIFAVVCHHKGQQMETILYYSKRFDFAF